jgi:threonine/homoserine/homoserine lactone efflux protein
METAFLLKGLAVGFLLCAPLGPVGILCIRRTLIDGRLAGFFSILGAAVVDAFYGVVAAYGMSAVGGVLDHGKFWFQLFGGTVLVVVGIRLYTAAGSISRTSQGHIRSSADAFLSMLSLMLSNPLPILVIGAALSAFTGSKLQIDFFDIPLFAFGIFLGSLLWSPILLTASTLISPVLQPGHLTLISRVCGAVIFICGFLLGVAPLVAPSM